MPKFFLSKNSINCALQCSREVVAKLEHNLLNVCHILFLNSFCEYDFLSEDEYLILPKFSNNLCRSRQSEYRSFSNKRKERKKFNFGSP